MKFVNLNAQRELIKDEIGTGLSAVLDHRRFILGPEVEELEQELSAFCGAD